MKKFAFLIVLLLGLASCDSKSNTENTEAVETDSVTVETDTLNTLEPVAVVDTLEVI